MRMNNKGMTTVEILMVFVIIGIISVGLFSMISTFNTKENIESAKEKVMTFKNTVTRDIEGDIIRRGLTSVSINPNHAINNNEAQFIATLTFKDGQKKDLKIYRKANEGFDVSSGACEGSGVSEEVFYIQYGTERYDLPDLGSSKNDCGHMTKDLRINTVDMTNKNNIFFLKVVFYHPDLSTRYYLNIITPINYGDISGTYTDTPFADSIIKINSTSSVKGNIYTNENGRGMTRSGTVGVLTLSQVITAGTTTITQQNNMTCTYKTFDGQNAASKVTVSGNYSNLTVKMNTDEAIAVRVQCSASIKDETGVLKTETYDGWVGNGWATNGTVAANACYQDSKRNKTIYYSKGAVKNSGLTTLPMYIQVNQPLQNKKFYFPKTGDTISGSQCSNAGLNSGVPLTGICTVNGTKYYFSDACVNGNGTSYPEGSLLPEGSYNLRANKDSEFNKPITINSSGVCTSGC